MIKGYATLNDTKNYLQRKFIKKASVDDEYYISSIGCGTYLGFPSEEIDLQYEKAIKKAITNGVNLIDTAINYRGMRSEVVVGKSIKDMIDEKRIKRSEIIVATKGGYLPADYRNILVNENYRETIKKGKEDFFKGNIAPKIDYSNEKIQEILLKGNTIKSEVIESLFEESRKNLELETIDIYYLHNPESSMERSDEKTFYEEMIKTFVMLEEKIKQGKLRWYGVSTYSAFIVNKDDERHLSLEKIAKAAEKAGGKDNHLRFIQLPLNKGMRDAEINKTQEINGSMVTPLDAACELDIKVTTNISLGQGKWFDKYSCEEMIEYLVENKKVCSSMIGMKKISNVEKNIKSIL